jgi:hypothetical protein
LCHLPVINKRYMKYDFLRYLSFATLAVALTGGANALVFASAVTSPVSTSDTQVCSMLTLTSDALSQTAGYTETPPANPATALMPATYSNTVLGSAVGTEYVSPWVDPTTNASLSGSGALWISTHTSWPGGTGNTEGGANLDQWRLFHDSFTLPTGAIVSNATLAYSSDNATEVYLNGNTTPLSTTNDVYGAVPGALPTNYATVTTVPFTPAAGTTTLDFVVRNWGGDYTENPTGLVYKAVVEYCVPVTAETVTVTIDKFIDGVQASTTNAQGASFPMSATWDASNVGAGSGAYALGPVGANSANPYEAVTADMTSGADYSTYEVVDNITVGENCSTDVPFALVGYSVGNTRAEAMTAVTSRTTPSFTDLTSDKYVIVRNRTCTDTATSTLTVIKNTVGGNGTFNFTSDNGILPFSITTTNGTGTVILSNLEAGTYHVTEGTQSGWTQTQNACSTIILGAGSSTTCTIVNTASTTVATTTLGEIRGTKYQDGKRDWRRHDFDWNHRGLSGWTIYLDSNDNNIFDVGEVSTITNWRGDYRFTSLPAGTYTVREVPQSGWIQVSPIAGKYVIVLSAGQKSKYNDFVNGRLGSISGMKYEDKNGNGRKDRWERGLSGWTIILKKNNVTVATTSTIADGSYSFSTLSPGLYKLSEVMKPGWKQTEKPNPVQIRSGTNARNEDFGNSKKSVRQWYDRGDDDDDD